MIPLWRPAVSLTGAVLLSFPLEHCLHLLPARGVVRWPLLALATLVGCYLFFAAPVLAALVATGVVGLVLRRRPAASVPERASLDAPSWPLVAASVAFVAAMVIDRAATPYFWDAFVWLAKARYAAGGLQGLIREGLHTTLPPFIPSGYPLLEPLIVAVLSGLSPRPDAVVAGAVGLEILTAMLFLCAIADGDPKGDQRGAMRLASVAIMLLTCPLVLVHLRSSYVDLPLGLLVATFAILLSRPRTGIACAIVAAAAAALKDEGMVHIAALSLVGVGYGLIERRDEALVRRAIASGLCASAVMGAWHYRMSVSGMANVDHALSFPDAHRVSALAHAVIDHALEIESWGALGVLAVGGVVAVVVDPRTAPGGTVWLAALLLADVVVLFAALLATPARVMEFVMEGTLLNRLGMQLAPLAAVLVAGWMAPDQTSKPPPSTTSD